MPVTTARETHENLGFNLVLLARMYRRELDEALKPYRLSEAATLPLRYLGRAGQGVRQGVIAQALAIEGPTLIRVLAQLEERGLVQRRACPDDGRGTVVALTDAGLALNRQLGSDLATLRRRLFAGIDEDDLAACLRVFETVNERLRGLVE